VHVIPRWPAPNDGRHPAADHRPATYVVTGCAGFIGSHVADVLLERGDRVLGIDAFTESYARETKQANVAGLVYIAAFAPDKGESVSALIKDPPPGAPVPPILPPQDGYLSLDRAQFRASFAADVSAEAAANEE